MAQQVNPYGDSRAKGEQVEEMFDNIAPAYDLMNTLMSMGMHRRWRNLALRRAIRLLGHTPSRILDVATGTGDLAFALHDLHPDARIAGIDLSEGMLAIGKRKLAAMPEAERKKIEFKKADCLDLPFVDGEFDLVTVAYGVRNFQDIPGGLREMLRVLKRGGVLCVVELSVPSAPLLRFGYHLYTRGLIPLAGRLASGDGRAYSYLPESIEATPQRGDMAAIMKECGFEEVEYKSLFPGVVTLYYGKKL